MLDIDDNNQVSKIKAWNPAHLLIISILLSFLATIFFYSINYKRFGDNKKFKISLISIVLMLLTIVLLISMYPDILPYKGILKFLNFTVPVYFWYDQSESYKDFLVQGGKAASIALPLLISLTITALLIVLMFI